MKKEEGNQSHAARSLWAFFRSNLYPGLFQDVFHDLELNAAAMGIVLVSVRKDGPEWHTTVDQIEYLWLHEGRRELERAYRELAQRALLKPAETFHRKWRRHAARFTPWTHEVTEIILPAPTLLGMFASTEWLAIHDGLMEMVEEGYLDPHLEKGIEPTEKFYERFLEKYRRLGLLP